MARRRPPRLPPSAIPLLCLSAVVAAVAWGLARGVWLANLHNGLLALSSAGVGAYVLAQRPGHRTGLLLVATGVVEAVLFTGRQVGHAPGSAGDRWWGWLGVWPVAVGLALTTLSILSYPDGRLPSRRWRPAVAATLIVTLALAGTSAAWPVEYAATGVTTPHPWNLPGGSTAAEVWGAVAHPIYAALQLSWVVAVVSRWRLSQGPVRVQLAWVAAAAAISAATLFGGLLIVGSPVPGLLTTPLVPVTAGWAIVHGRQLGARAALSWLSRASVSPERMPDDLARAVGTALDAHQVVLYLETSNVRSPSGCGRPPTPRCRPPQVRRSGRRRTSRARCAPTATWPASWRSTSRAGR